VHRHRHASETLLLVPVVVRRGRVAGLPCRLQPGVVQRIVQAPIAVIQRTVAAAVLRIAALVRIGAAEIGQHIAITPALGALFFPAVEIERVAAYPNHSVDRGRTPQHLAARRGQPSSAQMRLRLGGKTPIVFRHVHRDRQRGRHLNQHRAIRAAELQQQHAGLAVLGQPVRQYAARRAGADYDIVEIIHPQSRQSTLQAPCSRTRTAQYCASLAERKFACLRSQEAGTTMRGRRTPLRNSRISRRTHIPIAAAWLLHTSRTSADHGHSLYTSARSCSADLKTFDASPPDTTGSRNYLSAVALAAAIGAAARSSLRTGRSPPSPTRPITQMFGDPERDIGCHQWQGDLDFGVVCP